MASEGCRDRPRNVRANLDAVRDSVQIVMRDTRVRLLSAPSSPRPRRQQLQRFRRAAASSNQQETKLLDRVANFEAQLAKSKAKSPPPPANSNPATRTQEGTSGAGQERKRSGGRAGKRKKHVGEPICFAWNLGGCNMRRQACAAPGDGTSPGDRGSLSALPSHASGANHASGASHQKL